MEKEALKKNFKQFLYLFLENQIEFSVVELRR